MNLIFNHNLLYFCASKKYTMKFKIDLREIISYVATKKFWVELIIMTLGMVVTACAVYYFLVPSKLIIGTISGLSIVISGICEQFFGFPLNVSTVILVINAILLILAYILIDKEFGIKTVYTALILGPLIGVLEKYFPYENFIDKASEIPSIMGDLWLDLCCFVLLLSLAQAVLFKINASTGGLDILAKIVNKYLHFDIGTSVSVAGWVICCTAFMINDARLVIIGLIGTWINGLVVDYFTASLNRRKKVCIISTDHERIKKYIINDLSRGVTLYDVEGGYTGEKKVELVALLSTDEFSDLMKFINNNEINAFITAGNVSEVYGLWGDKNRLKNTKNVKEGKSSGIKWSISILLIVVVAVALWIFNVFAPYLKSPLPKYKENVEAVVDTTQVENENVAVMDTIAEPIVEEQQEVQ